jgi:hypothetical protein
MSWCPVSWGLSHTESLRLEGLVSSAAKPLRHNALEVNSAAWRRKPGIALLQGGRLIGLLRGPSSGLLVRQLAACVFDNERSFLNRRSREKARASARTADTESSLAGHITHLRRFARGSGAIRCFDPR